MAAVVPLTTHDISLPRYERMCKAIAVCHRIDEVKGIQDKAAALRAYARQLHNHDAEIQFAEIKVRAERRCGELMEELKKTGERAASGQTRGSKLKIRDLGMSQMDAHRFRQTAAVPVERFEAHLAERRMRGLPVSSLSVRSLAGVRVGVPSENKKALDAIETLSELQISPAQFAKWAIGTERERVLLAITTATPWLTAASKLIG
jgi:hypothetical protein